jgi:hypothetical protein
MLFVLIAFVVVTRPLIMVIGRADRRLLSESIDLEPRATGRRDVAGGDVSEIPQHEVRVLHALLGGVHRRHAPSHTGHRRLGAAVNELNAIGDD